MGAALAHRIKEERWKRSFLTFLKEAVQIEDRDVKGLAIPFEVWPEQEKVARIFCDERLVVALKARQLGLTWLALSYSLWKKLFWPGWSTVALSKRETPDAKELIRRQRFILRHLPTWLVQQKGKTQKGYGGRLWSDTALTIEIEHPGDEPSYFTSMTSSADSGRSFTANLVVLDEWAFQQYAQEIWDSAFPVINRPTGGQVIGISTGKRGTLFEEIFWDAWQGKNTFTAVFLPWWSDPRRDEQWFEDTKKNLPNTWRQEYPAVPDDAFALGEGAFFPQWDYEKHVLDDIGWYPPDVCQIEGAYDAGFGSRACFKWYAVFPDGKAVCYREYYPRQVTDDEQARDVLKMSKRLDGTPEYLHRIYADPSCWNRQSGTGESTAEIFLKNGVVMLPADNDLANGWRRLHQWLNPGKTGVPYLRFTYACANTIRTYPACEQSDTNPEDISKKSEHHAQDVDRYFVMGRPQPQEVEITKTGRKLPWALVTENKGETHDWEEW